MIVKGGNFLFIEKSKVDGIITFSQGQSPGTRLHQHVVHVAVIAANELDDLVAAGVAALAKPLAADKSWIEPRSYETEESQGIGLTILHAEADHSLMVETVCWQAGRGVAPHDHQTWGVVIGLDGEETNVNWRRRDDVSQEGHADLEVAEEIIIRCGDVVRLPQREVRTAGAQAQS